MIDFEFLSPVSQAVLAHNQLLSSQCIGNAIKIHTEEYGLPDIDGVQLAIVGVSETRNAVQHQTEPLDLNEIRKEFYSLFLGNWSAAMVDLGNILQGETVEDTYFAVKELVSFLVKKKIVPIVIGGSHDLTYSLYRAFDQLEQMVNLTVIDHQFDLGAADDEMTSKSYLSKIIAKEPHNLFNFSNIGYQTYFNAQEHIDLMDQLYFDVYRLGEIINDITLVEPVLRDTDIVSIDMKSVRAADLGHVRDTTPNGFDGREICGISRYAGISDKVSVFGVFETITNCTVYNQLTAQVIWYFIEGFNFRKKDYPFITTATYEKYIVPLDEQEDLIFFKSDISERWWIEIATPDVLDTKMKIHTLLPCTYQDYLDASDLKIPERWWKAYKKMLV
ncbi:formimidoylglutamase [Zhouia sp. PK063]|uniref:formimidoylglutamase n=1 Tax=Zhouia sp. PK063 TaxID=3373602 RepID=UPI00379AB869